MRAHESLAFGSAVGGLRLCVSPALDHRGELQWLLVLRYGSCGPDVPALQRALNKQGAHLKVDGDFGADAERAVEDVQRHAGLTPDGWVGSRTQGSGHLAPTVGGSGNGAHTL
ncbi:MAG: peptidoglycan-binding domain-containing protein [Brevundimonas sp.]